MAVDEPPHVRAMLTASRPEEGVKDPRLHARDSVDARHPAQRPTSAHACRWFLLHDGALVGGDVLCDVELIGREGRCHKRGKENGAKRTFHVHRHLRWGTCDNAEDAHC